MFRVSLMLAALFLFNGCTSRYLQQCPKHLVLPPTEKISLSRDDNTSLSRAAVELNFRAQKLEAYRNDAIAANKFNE